MAVDPFLTIAGIPIPVALNAASETLIVRGKTERAYSNNARSTVDPNAKREWSVTTIPMDPAAVATFRAAAANGSRQNVSGRMVGGGIANPSAPVVCVVEYGQTQFRGKRPKLVALVLALTLREV